MIGRTRVGIAAAIAIVLFSCSTARMAAAEPLDLLEPPGTFEAALPESTAGAPESAPSAPLAPDSVTAQPAPAVTPPKLGMGARARRAVGNFASDGWAVVKGPFEARGTRLLLMAGTLGAGAVIYNNDQDILDATLRNRDEPALKAVIDVGNGIEPVGLMGRTNPIYAAALAAGYAFNIRVLRTIPTEILESHLIAGGVRNVGKVLVGRRHPYEHVGPYEFDFGHGTSFPSGHTSVGFELATIASMNARSLPVTIVAYSLATALAVQRVESLNHWPSDVFIAAAYGTMVARTVVSLHEKREAKQAPGFSLLPELSDDGRVTGVRVTRSF